MTRLLLSAGAALLLTTGTVWAGPFEDATAANKRGDYATALKTFQLLASQGSAEAQNSLGMLYVYGQGVPQDYGKARQWFEKAAAQGYTPAEYNLGMLYANSQGVLQDDVRAHMWYTLAEAHFRGADQERAADNRDKVARRMTSAQIAEAERLTQQCQAQQFKGC